MSSFIKALRNTGTPIEGKENIFISGNDRWVIGPYNELKQFAVELRNSPFYTTILKEKGARFGRRDTDKIPEKAHPKECFRKKIKDIKISPARIDYLKTHYSKERKESNEKFVERLTDLFEDAKEWFDSITLESHHIFEGDAYRKLKKDKGDFAYEAAPCVLVRGELHRRLFTVQGNAFRKENEMTKENLLKFYSELYRGPAFHDLLVISKTVIEELFKK